MPTHKRVAEETMAHPLNKEYYATVKKNEEDYSKPIYRGI